MKITRKHTQFLQFLLCCKCFGFYCFLRGHQSFFLNILFIEVLGINKWLRESDQQKGHVQIYAGMEIGPL